MPVEMGVMVWSSGLMWATSTPTACVGARSTRALATLEAQSWVGMAGSEQS